MLYQLSRSQKHELKLKSARHIFRQPQPKLDMFSTVEFYSKNCVLSTFKVETYIEHLDLGKREPQDESIQIEMWQAKILKIKHYQKQNCITVY